MNSQKIRELCARAMGYTIIDNLHVKDVNGNWVVDGSDYSPIDDANQADDLLEYVAFNLGCSWSCGYNILASEYWCEIPTVKGIFIENRRTQNLAKILCALRASDKVTDAEINDAWEGE